VFANAPHVSPDAIPPPDDREVFSHVQQSVAGFSRSGMSFSVTILGCGFSGGVPRPGLGWGRIGADAARS
jgi:hypothetical protein